MKAMILNTLCKLNECSTPLTQAELPIPTPAENEMLLKVSACGVCAQCRNGKENLCADFKATGRDAHGCYAEFMIVEALKNLAPGGRLVINAIRSAKVLRIS